MAKFTSLFCFCLVLMLAGSHSGVSAGQGPVEVLVAKANPSPIGFCVQPYEFICGSGPQGAQDRAQRISRIRQEITTKALARAKAQTHSIKGHRFVTTYYTEVRGLILEYLFANGVPTELNFKPIQAAFLEALSESKSLNSSTKSQMRTIVQNIQFINLAQLRLQDFQSHRELELESKRKCGSDGLEDNAFATEIESKVGSPQDVVVVCPGAIVAAVEFAKNVGLNQEHLLAGLAMTLAHEIGHHIDTERFSTAYRNVFSCVEHNWRPLLDHETSKYMREIIADAWGAKVLAKYLSHEKNPHVRGQIIRGSLDDLCEVDDQSASKNEAKSLFGPEEPFVESESIDVDSAEDEEEILHPPGIVRINELIRTNIEIENMFQCPKKSGVICSLEGS